MHRSQGEEVAQAVVHGVILAAFDAGMTRADIASELWTAALNAILETHGPAHLAQLLNHYSTIAEAVVTDTKDLAAATPAGQA